MRLSITYIVLSVLMSTSASALADSASFKTGISKIFTDDVNFGGCMVGVSPGPADSGLDCKNAFVTLDCKGDYGPKDAAARKLAAAQLAFVTGQNVIFFVDDTRKHNGYCLATRVDNVDY